MNLPNKLTILRVALVPVFLFFMLASFIPHHYLWALIFFTLASFTDLLDGKIARSRGLVTDFGKFMDPLADKILVMSAMLCFVQLGWAPALAVIIILAREFLVTSLRLIAAGQGTVIAADIWGKAKTVVQMIWVPYCIFIHWLLSAGFAWLSGPNQSAWAALLLFGQLLLYASVLLTLISGANYVWKNRSCIHSW